MIDVTRKPIVVCQPRFLGDIIYISALAQSLVGRYSEIIIPVDDQFITSFRIHEYIPCIKFVPFTEKYAKTSRMLPGYYEFKDYFLLNLSNTSIYKKHMQLKYSLCSLPIDKWRQILISRNYERESQLKKLLNIKPGEKFNLVNSLYSNKSSDWFSPEIDNSYRNVYLKKIDGFNLFDWMGVVEEASSIHTIHTSLQYLIDILPNTTKDLHIYPRYEIYEPHSYYDYLFLKKYFYHPHPISLGYRINFFANNIKNIVFRLRQRIFLSISTFLILNYSDH